MKKIIGLILITLSVSVFGQQIVENALVVTKGKMLFSCDHY
ncbi:hypothetical protein FHR24_002392 [Wenyingzhuangia heitensis]|uniref:Uncharacterized protein n=1 Tax=Wenyingzhuangia heitensis TaxID=1487859 RepID=A0ABX0UEH1_9FLAO|nr:hypothetical protein [Wenyingzhuangia heitensis]NIJ45921.1 hypothetical protein [Wenyingzhuangia heitensis]